MGRYLPVFHPGPLERLSLLHPCDVLYEGNTYPTGVHALAAYYLRPSLRKGKNCFGKEGCLSSVEALRAWLRNMNPQEDSGHIRMLRAAASRRDADIGAIVAWICFGAHQNSFDELVDFCALRKDLVIDFDGHKKIGVDDQGRRVEHALTDGEKEVVERYIIPAMFRDEDTVLELLNTKGKPLVCLDIPSRRWGAIWTYANPLHGRPYEGLNGLGRCLEMFRAKLRADSRAFLQSMFPRQRLPASHEEDEAITHALDGLRVY